MIRVDDRHPRVLALLLSSLLDYMPAPKLSIPRPDSKLTPLEWETCPGCKGEQKIKRGDAKVKCQRCEGRGGWHVDPYDRHRKKIHYVDLTGKDSAGRYVTPGVDEEPEGERAHAIRQAVRALSDHTLLELDRLIGDGGTWRDPPPPKSDPDPLLDALERQARYRSRQRWALELEAALKMLPPFDRLLLGCAYVSGWFPPGQMVPVLRWRLVIAVLGLRAALPPSFRAPMWAVDRARGELAVEEAERRRRPRDLDRLGRDTLIRAMSANGRSLRQIAARVGMTAEGVRKVLARQEREAA